LNLLAGVRLETTLDRGRVRCQRAGLAPSKEEILVAVQKGLTVGLAGLSRSFLLALR
jgi:hypothetical protein